jgi:glycine/D-amino acid oxidase-like deaminating enzyme
LWVLCGLGSRGGTTAALTAEVLAAQLCGEAVEQQLMLALHPARSLISALKKRPEHRAKNDCFLRVTESFSG